MRYEAVGLALFAMMTLSCESAGRVSDAVPSSDDTSRLEQAHADTRGLGDPALPGIDRPDSTLASRLAAALDAKAVGYKPRTHHLRSDGGPIFTNRLIFETSPYLLQHAHNPVNWYAWGDEPFERAARENKPVLLSIGYSTCHWCHVMERESFEDEEIAAYINRHYVAIKVDREERPDIDDVYMTAVQMMTGRGGWPMTVVLTPERKPFFGGTYFPARDGDRGARVGFLTILQRLSDLYANQRERADEQAEKVSRGIQEAGALGASPGLPNGTLLHDAVRKTVRSFDPVWGGLGSALKFPRPVTYELLLRYHRRTGDEKAREIVRLSLEKMAAGGMYDHAGGGFHRYSTDRAWLVPHFEKMLYDNAQLVPLYLEANQLTGDADFARVARETLDYLVREMTSPDGAFYSATDADSITPDGHSEEGWFFTWTPAEIRSILPANIARVVETYYAVTDGGNFEHRNILHTPSSLAEVAAELSVEPAELRATIDNAREVLRTERARRSPPLLDDKIIAAWNGFAISAFARGALVLGRDDYRNAARRAADLVLTRMRRSDGGLWRTYKDGRARHLGVLDDYAFVVQALLDTYEATGEIRWMDAAIELQRYADEHFFDTEVGGYFGTSHTHEALLARTRPLYDGAEPSGNSVAILNLLRLEEMTGDDSYRRRAEAALAAFAPALAANPSVAPKMLSALDFLLDEPFEVIVVKPDNTRERDAALLDALRSTYLPNRVLAVVDETAAAAQSARIPLLEGKRAIDGRTTAYVCKKGVCKRPTSDPSELARQLGEIRRLEG